MSTSHRGTKPKAGQLLTLQLVCMCCRIHCLNRVDSSGFLQSNIVCENEIQSNRNDRPFFNK